MDESIRQIAALSARQHGLITRAQLRGLGLTKRQIDHAVGNDRLTLVHRAVYRIAGSAPTDDGALAAALLLTEGVASHRSAAQLIGLVDARPTAPEITVGPTRSQRAAGVIVRRSSDLVGSDVIRTRGLRCTN